MKEINYSEIDKECVGLVKLFNGRGLTTEFSCEGHPGDERTEFYIIFNNTVSNKTMYKFISKHPGAMGEFMKWVRVSGQDKSLVSNWIYSINNNTPEINHQWAKIDLKTFLETEQTKDE